MLNGLFCGEAEKLAQAIRARWMECKCVTRKDPQTIIQSVFVQDPRLIAIVQSIDLYTTTYNQLVSVTFMIHYRPGSIQQLEDVVLDDGHWKPSMSFSPLQEYPVSVNIVSKDAENLVNRFQHDQQFLDQFPGFIQAHSSYVTMETFPEYSFATIIFEMCLNEKEYIRAQKEARLVALKTIDSKLGGRGVDIPNVMKAFLAFSYLQQTVQYDNLAAKATDSRVSYPYSVIPYGPILNHLGICAGIAAAYQMMMEIYGIKSHVVSGALLGNDGTWGPHAWNMIQIGSHWYHIDATINIKPDPEVYTESFMKPDKVFRKDHRWEKDDYPACISSLLGYGKIEELLENGNPAYQQAEQRYLNPQIFD